MTTVSNAAKVKAFGQAVGDAIPDRPQLPDQRTLALREALIDEEYQEVKRAIATLWTHLSTGEGNQAPNEALCALVHELADLLYVTYGTFWACGVDPDRVFAAVHEANMAKLSGPQRADGKQLKPPGWQPADIVALVQKLAQQD